MWVRKVLEALPGSKILGKPEANDLRDAPNEIIHREFKEALAICGGHKRFFFSFVRNPYTWMASFYAHRAQSPKWVEHDWSRKSFERWVMCSKKGWVQSHFERFAGPKRHPVDFIGRFENLKDDLWEALERAGEEFTEDIFDVPPQNVGDPKILAQCEWTEEMRRHVYELNPRAFSRFGYCGPGEFPGGKVAR
jgi:hypothetical protein